MIEGLWSRLGFNRTWNLTGHRPMLNTAVPLLVGIGLRLWLYGLNDSLWRDESMLLLNIAQKSFWELTGPLTYAQGAPIPVLWLYRALYLLGLKGELPMRALSLGASILALVLYYRLARLALVHPRGVLFSTWLLALSPGAILFAAQVKPYALDLLIACGFLCVAAPWFLGDGIGGKKNLLFWYAGLAPWFSFPAIFVAGGVAGGLLLNAPRRGMRPALLFISVVILSFGFEYLTIIRHNFSDGTYILFLKNLRGSGALQIGLFTPLLAYFPFLDYFGKYPRLFWMLWAMGIYCIVVGIWAAGRKHGWAWVSVLLVPWLLALLASSLQHYPIYGRCFLFATPGLYLFLGYAVGYISEVSSWQKLVSAGLILVLCLCAAASILTVGRPIAGVREGLQFIDKHKQKNDILLCDTYALPTVTYYRLIEAHNAQALNCNVGDLEKFAWGRRLPYQITYEEMLPFIPPARQVWCLAEAEGYAREKDKQVLPYWQELTCYLQLERHVQATSISGRVEVKEFSAATSEIRPPVAEKSPQ